MDLVCGLACHESFIAQWLEHPTGVQKVIGSILVRDSDFFFVPCLSHVDHVVSCFFTELKSTINLYLSHTWQFWHFYHSSMHYACHTWTLAHHESFVAQCLEHLTCVQVVIGSIPVGTRIFSLPHARNMLMTSFLKKWEVFWWINCPFFGIKLGCESGETSFSLEVI